MFFSSVFGKRPMSLRSALNVPVTTESLGFPGRKYYFARIYLGGKKKSASTASDFARVRLYILRVRRLPI